jgi:hypothetical protein
MPARPGSSRRLLLGSFIIQKRIAEVPPPSACAPTRVRAGVCSSADSLSTADGGRIEHPQDVSPDLRFPAGYLASRSAIHERKARGSNARGTPAPTSV